GVGEKGELQHAVRGRSELTFYSRFPWLVTALCWLLLGFAILPAAFTPGAGVTGRARGKRP
ncbi:MAG: hypothetical protein OEM62_12105, partial [Acidobacteriota bacterium]|nr:hypothetical protein [Acidobacteriota bacterium]